MAGHYTKVAELRREPVSSANLGELGVLIRAIEAVDQPRERLSLEALAEHLDGAGADPVRDTCVLRDRAGDLVGYAWNLPQHGDVTLRRVVLTGGVRPDRRRTGIGHQLLSWQLTAAREWDARTRRPEHGPLRHLLRVDNALAAAQHLAEAHDLRASRWFVYLSQLFSERPPAPAPVPGVELVRLTPELSEATRSTHNTAFADHWGGQPMGQEQWREELALATARPQWCLAAVEQADGAVVGYAINAAYEAEWDAQGYTEGQTERLGVLREWRHRGVASALLRRSMQLFHEAGLAGAGLGVDSDNPTGAYPLYQGLGYRLVGGFVVHTRTEPGDEG